MDEQWPSWPEPDPGDAPGTRSGAAPNRGRSRGPWFLGLTLLLVIAVGMVVAYQTTRVPDPSRTLPPPRLAAAPPSTQAGDDPAADNAGNAPRPVYRLADNPLETGGLHLAPSSCELPGYPADDDGRKAFYTAAQSCLDTVWQPVLGAANLPFAPPKLVLFGSKVGTPCGEGLETEGAFYCDGSATIYVSPQMFAKTERIGNAQTGVFLAIMAHEYGHHVQDLSGIFTEAGGKRDKAGKTSPAGLEISRRIELQANCFAGMFFAAVEGRGSVPAKAVRQASADIAHRGDTKQGPADHGSLAHSAMWFERGRQAGDTAACNTWTAPPGDVS